MIFLNRPLKKVWRRNIRPKRGIQSVPLAKNRVMESISTPLSFILQQSNVHVSSRVMWSCSSLPDVYIKNKTNLAMKIFTRCNISNSVSGVVLKGHRPCFILFKASSFVRSMPFLYSRLFLQSRLLFINFVVSKKQSCEYKKKILWTQLPLCTEIYRPPFFYCYNHARLEYI